MGSWPVVIVAVSTSSRCLETGVHQHCKRARWCVRLIALAAGAARVAWVAGACTCHSAAFCWHLACANSTATFRKLSPRICESLGKIALQLLSSARGPANQLYARQSAADCRVLTTCTYACLFLLVCMCVRIARICFGPGLDRQSGHAHH